MVEEEEENTWAATPTLTHAALTPTFVVQVETTPQIYSCHHRHYNTGMKGTSMLPILTGQVVNTNVILFTRCPHHTQVQPHFGP